MTAARPVWYSSTCFQNTFVYQRLWLSSNLSQIWVCVLAWQRVREDRKNQFVWHTEYEKTTAIKPRAGVSNHVIVHG